jgi:hypothetical protein
MTSGETRATIYQDNGETYAELWREGGLLKMAIFARMPGVVIHLDERVIPQLIEALRGIQDDK